MSQPEETAVMVFAHLDVITLPETDRMTCRVRAA